MKQPKLTDNVSDHVMTIEELWEALGKLVKIIVEDNQKYNGRYPLASREIQMASLTTLVNEIEKFHKKFREGEK